MNSEDAMSRPGPRVQAPKAPAPQTNKYLRALTPVPGVDQPVFDVYSVLEGFNVACPAVQHAVKKLLCAGLRGKGNREQDLIEARVAIDRAIQMEQSKVP